MAAVWEDSVQRPYTDLFRTQERSQTRRRFATQQSGLKVSVRVLRSSDRILLVRIHGKPFNLSIIQVYAPTSASSEEEIEDFDSDLEDAYKKCGNQDIVIVMGDLNAKIGDEQDPLQEIVGKHGLRERNDRGDL